MSPPEWIFQAVWIKIVNIHFFNNYDYYMAIDLKDFAAFGYKSV